MEIIINEKSYYVNYNDSLEDLLSNLIFDDFTINQWIELLEYKTGVCSEYSLYKIMLHLINKYDSSENVNSFLYNNKNYWFSKDVRTGLLNVANNLKGEVELALGDDIIKIDSEKLKKFLANLEVYAQKCFVNTKKHINAIKEIRELEDLINYDYTKGYPEKLELNVDTAV